MFRTKTIHPDAQFPALAVHRQVPFAGNSMPSRPAKQDRIRNLTGLYLGADVGRVTSPKHAVPPLARGRGMPSHKIRTPTEERRYKKVELLRTKEDKKGFSGNPLKRKQMLTPAATEHFVTNDLFNDQPQVTFWDLTKQTARKFTAANNSGVTHLEFLNPDPQDDIHRRYPHAFEANMTETIAREIQTASHARKDITGVIDCYKKICRSNVEALLSLLPPQQVLTGNQRNTQHKTGFSVKSYRNPNTAEIMASFPPEDNRPKTVLGTTTRPHIPSPYFFKNYQPHCKSAMDKYRDYEYPPYSDDQRAPPGTGQLSRSVSRGRDNISPGRANSPIDADLIQPQLDIIDQENLVATTTSRKDSRLDCQPENTTQQEDPVDAISVPKAESLDGIESSIDHTIVGEADAISVPGAEATEESDSTAKYISESSADKHTEEQSMANAAAGNTFEKMASGSEIIIGVEDEKGEQKPVEIDDTDDQMDDEVSSNGSLRRKVSITERILKSKNSEEQNAHLTQDAENRKKQLEELLDEHAQIVHEVNSLQVHENKENLENQPTATDPTPV